MDFTNPQDPVEVRNMDVVGIVERIDRYAFDITHFESASLNEVSTYDVERMQAYQAGLRTYASTVNSASFMDLPHSYPFMYQIKYITGGIDFDVVKNKALRDVLRLYLNAMVQWSRSESADRSNGFAPADYSRFLLIMDRVDQYLASYVVAALPEDVPHSSAYEQGRLLA